jgi:uncharacterized protein YndB with AHSA1/START domain
MVMSRESSIAVRRSVTVTAAPQQAFDVFTAAVDTWWPRSHHIGARERFTAVLEPRAGGRWFERGDDGTECDWGRVQVWDPPARVVLTWQIGSDWKFDPDLVTEVEVRFVVDGPGRTRVELEHRGLEAYGDQAVPMRETFEGPGAWAGILDLFARRIAAA